MKFILTLIALIFFNPFFVFSQDKLKRNIEIFDEIVDHSFDELENRMVLAGKDEVFAIILADVNDQDEYILEKLRRRLSGYNVIYRTSYDSIFADIVVDSIQLRTRYLNISTSKVFGDKVVERKISVSFRVRLLKKVNNETLYFDDINESFIDSFKLDDLSRVESGQYSFLKAELPSEGFLGKYLLPIVLIAASAVTIILFFVIRSD